MGKWHICRARTYNISIRFQEHLNPGIELTIYRGKLNYIYFFIEKSCIKNIFGKVLHMFIEVLVTGDGAH